MTGADRDAVATGPRVLLSMVGDGDLEAVMGVYADSVSFFRAVAGVDVPPREYVMSDMQEGPPGHADGKRFLAVHLRTTGELIGVLDFVVGYPRAGEGFIGLLLVAERHQGLGLGRESVTVVEEWARREHGVQKVTLGVELANEKARAFWRKCGYSREGELFQTSVLGRDQQAEVLTRRLERASGAGDGPVRVSEPGDGPAGSPSPAR